MILDNKNLRRELERLVKECDLGLTANELYKHKCSVDGKIKCELCGDWLEAAAISVCMDGVTFGCWDCRLEKTEAGGIDE